ncbi:hypothetical protein TNCV_764611 [Trichonephila clavipes]|nr:hypothetical protein TNCV_764611 [Trichonephila clavipes]
MEGMARISADFTPYTNKKRIPALLVQNGNGAALLNSVLRSNDYKGRQVTRCIEVLPTTHYSVVNTSAVAKL